MRYLVGMSMGVGVLLFVGWLAWAWPFFLIKRGAEGGASEGAGGGAAPTIDRRARWGIFLEFVAFFLIWQPRFRVTDPGAGRMSAAIVAYAAAAWLSWNSARTLGRQWRFDAGLNAQHDLIRTGAYAIVRHPIYTSMFALLIGTGLLLTPWLLLLASVPLFVAGTEIRVRIEDRLLASRFGDTFTEYRRRVPAYVPFLRGFGGSGK